MKKFYTGFVLTALICLVSFNCYGSDRYSDNGLFLEAYGEAIENESEYVYYPSNFEEADINLKYVSFEYLGVWRPKYAKYNEEYGIILKTDECTQLMKEKSDVDTEIINSFPCNSEDELTDAIMCCRFVQNNYSYSENGLGLSANIKAKNGDCKMYGYVLGVLLKERDIDFDYIIGTVNGISHIWIKAHINNEEVVLDPIHFEKIQGIIYEEQYVLD